MTLAATSHPPPSPLRPLMVRLIGKLSIAEIVQEGGNHHDVSPRCLGSYKIHVMKYISVVTGPMVRRTLDKSISLQFGFCNPSRRQHNLGEGRLLAVHSEVQPLFPPRYHFVFPLIHLLPRARDDWCRRCRPVVSVAKIARDRLAILGTPLRYRNLSSYISEQ